MLLWTLDRFLLYLPLGLNVVCKRDIADAGCPDSRASQAKDVREGHGFVGGIPRPDKASTLPSNSEPPPQDWCKSSSPHLAKDLIAAHNVLCCKAALTTENGKTGVCCRGPDVPKKDACKKGDAVCTLQQCLILAC